MRRSIVRVSTAGLVFALAAEVASAACLNRFVSRAERPRQIVTLLTGKLTFQEAQDLAKAIQAKESPPIEWIDDNGKTVAKQIGPLKVVRPMPVGCDDRKSGVVIIAEFLAAVAPTDKMIVRLRPDSTVEFEEQKQ